MFHFSERIVERRPTKATTTTSKPVETVTERRQEIVRRKKPQPFEKIKPATFSSANEFSEHTYRPVIDYDYYDDGDTRIVPKTGSQVKYID